MTVLRVGLTHFGLEPFSLSFDVEINVSPQIDEQLTPNLENRKASSRELNSIRGKLESPIFDATKRFASIEGKIESHSKTGRRDDSCKRAVTKINDQIASLMDKTGDLENGSHHNNWIVYGVGECETKSTTSLS